MVAVSQGLALSALAFAGGCETKGFVDPTEMGRYKKDPLVLPVTAASGAAAVLSVYTWAGPP